MALEANLQLLFSNAATNEVLVLLHRQLYSRSTNNKSKFDLACRNLRFSDTDEDAGAFVKALIQKISPENASGARIAASYVFMRIGTVAKFAVDALSSDKLNRFLLVEADELVQCNVVRAMSNLAPVNQNAGLFAASVPRILIIIRETRDVTLLVNCFRAIRYLCSQSHLIRQLVKHDVLLSKICDILQDSSAALKHVSTDEADFYEHDADEGNIAKASDDAARTQRETRLRAAVSTLAFISRHAQLFASSSPYLQHLERAVPLVAELTHHEHADIQTAAFSILLNLSECPAARPALETGGAIQSLIDHIAPIGLSSFSLTRGNSATQSQLESARALFLLCADGSSRSRIRRLGALRVMLQILRAEQYKPVWMRGMESILMFNYDSHALKELLSIGLMEVLFDKLNMLLGLVHRQMVQDSAEVGKTTGLSSCQIKPANGPASPLSLAKLPKTLPTAPNIAEVVLAALDSDGELRCSASSSNQPLKRRRLTPAARLSLNSSSPSVTAISLTAFGSPLSNKNISNLSVADSAASSPQSINSRFSRSSTPIQSPLYSRAMSPTSRNFDVCGDLLRSLDRLTASSPPYNSPPYRSPVPYSGESSGRLKRQLHETDIRDGIESTSPARAPSVVTREASLCTSVVKFCYHLSHNDEFASYMCIEKFFATTARILLLFTSASMQTTPAAETARQLVSTICRSVRLCIRNRNCFESIIKAKCASWLDALGKLEWKLLPLPDDEKVYRTELSEVALTQIAQFRGEMLDELVNVAQSDYGFGTISHMLQSSNRDHIRRIVSLSVPHAYRRYNLLRRLLVYDGALRCLTTLVFESNLLNSDAVAKKSLNSDTTCEERYDDGVVCDDFHKARDPSNDDADDSELLVECHMNAPVDSAFCSSATGGDTDAVDVNPKLALRGLQLIMQSINNHAQRPGLQQPLFEVPPALTGNALANSLLSLSLTDSTCCLYEMFTESKPSSLPDDGDIIILTVKSGDRNAVYRCSVRRSALMRSSTYFEKLLADYWDGNQANDVTVNILGLEDIDLESPVSVSPTHRQSNGEISTAEDEAAGRPSSAKQLQTYRSQKRDEQIVRAFMHALHGCSPASCRLMAALWNTNRTQFILKFLLIADFFLCECLFTMCLSWVQENCLSEYSVADVYSLAQNRLTNVKGLGEACVRFVLGEVADVDRVLLIFCDFVQCSSVEILRSHVEQLFMRCLKSS